MSLVETKESAIDQVRVRVLPDGRMCRKDAAKYLGRAEKTLAMWQMEKKGPPSMLVGGRRFYFKEGLDAFVRGDAVPDDRPAISTADHANQLAKAKRRDDALAAKKARTEAPPAPEPPDALPTLNE